MPDTRGDDILALGPSPPTLSTRALWMAELRSLAALALPVVIQTSAQQGMTVTDQVFLGHLGTAELGAAALANAYTNLMWFFLLGFATALDTLGSHAYGAGDRRALVTWCVTAAVLLSLLVGPLAVGMALGEMAGRVLFGQDGHTSALMGRFCNGLILGMWPLMWGTVLTKYLQVQNIMLVPSLIAIGTFILNIAFNAALVHTIGFNGAPLATSLSRWAQFLMLAAAVWGHERQGRPTRGRRLSSGDGEEGAPDRAPAGLIESGTEGQSLQRLPDGAMVGDGAGADGSQCVVVVKDPTLSDKSLRGVTGVDRSIRGGSKNTPCYSGEALSLLADDRCRDTDDEGAGASNSGEKLYLDGADCSRLNGASPHFGTARDRGSGSESGVSGAEGATDLKARAVPPRAPAPVSLCRTVCGEIRLAMRPRVVVRFLRLGIPGGLGMAFEAGCFDFSTVLAGRLGAVATAAHAAMLSIVMFTYLTCPFALATAGAIRVGNLLGAGEPESARRAGVLAVALSGIFMALMALIILTTRSVLGYMFSTDPRVVAVIRELAIFAALFQVSDGLMGSSQGVLRGCGHQHLTAVLNFTGFWVCGVLLGFLLCFKAGMGLSGLWAGISTGDTATGVMNLFAMGRIKWHKEADKAVARLKALAEQTEEKQTMLGNFGADRVDAVGADGGLGAGSSGVVPLGGGGRSFAGGLKRMWSGRRLWLAAEEARAQRGLGVMARQNSMTSRIIRSLSSVFRRRQPQLLPQGELSDGLGGGSGGVVGSGGGSGPARRSTALEPNG